MYGSRPHIWQTDMKTPIYVKIDSHEQLLLSEGVCRQLEVITYHPAVEVWRGRKQPQPTIRKKVVPSLPTLESDIEQSKEGEERHTVIPRISVHLVKSLTFPPGKSAVVQVQVSKRHSGKVLLL